MIEKSREIRRDLIRATKDLIRTAESLKEGDLILYENRIHLVLEASTNHYGIKRFNTWKMNPGDGGILFCKDEDCILCVTDSELEIAKNQMVILLGESGGG